MDNTEPRIVDTDGNLEAGPSLLDPAFRYVPANKTDIAETFKRVRERMATDLTPTAEKA